MSYPIESLVLLNPGGGGVNEKVKGDAVRDNQSAPPDATTLALQNCHTNIIGAIVKRNGYSTYTDELVRTGSPSNVLENVNGLYQYEKNDDSQYELVSASDSSDAHIYDISTPASPSDITGSATLTNDKKLSFCKVNDQLIITTEARDTVLTWSGTGNVSALSGTPPTGKYCIEFENFCFIANTSSNPERIYFSALTNPESWTATDFFRLNGAIKGIGKSGTELFVFTESSITVLRYTGDAVAPFESDRLETSTGCASHHSIINREGILYWIAPDGFIWRMVGLRPERVNDVLPNTVARLNKTSLDRCVAVDHVGLNQLWFCFPLDSAVYNDLVIVYDYLVNEFFFYTGMTINCLGNFKDSSGEVKTYFGDRSGYVYLTSDGNQDNPAGVATAIDFYRYTKQFHMGKPNQVKRLRRIKATVNNVGSYTTTITTYGDFGLSGQTTSISHDGNSSEWGAFTWGTDTWGGPEDLDDFEDSADTAKFFQFKIANDDLNVHTELRDLSLFFQTYRGSTR